MSGGVRTALEEVLDGHADGEAEVQLDFLDLTEEETGRLDAPSPLARILVAPRKGRPPGSRNRRTEAVVSWLLTQHRHPLAVMMEAYTMSPAELAVRIGLVDADGKADADLLEIYKLQLRMAEAVAPYVAQRQPQAVALAAKGSLAISFEGVSLPARGPSAGGNGDLVEGLAVALPSPKSDE